MQTLLPRPWHKVLLTGDIGASVGALGADLSIIALAAAAQAKGGEAAYYAAAYLIADTVLGPLALGALASGVLLALTSGWGLFRYWWVTIKLAVVVGLSSAVLFVLIPGLEKAASSDTLAAPTLIAAPLAGSLLLLLAIVLGVFKPGWRLRRVPSRLSERA